MVFTLFLLSPANLGGQRADLLFNPKAAFPIARRLRSAEGAPLDEVFSFVSGLYFRGKVAYAQRFAWPPPGMAGALVITPGEGLRPSYEPVTPDRLRAWAQVTIDERNDRFTQPLMRHAAALERAYGASTRFVLLGSVATDKYVRPLASVFGDHLLFPSNFAGRGDMSRGALMLRAAREGVELSYEVVEGARRSRAAERGPSRTPP